jgi:hypothetical protein
MDKKTKIAIVVLIVFALLFFSGVGMNLVPKQRDSIDSRDEYEKADGGWEKTLGEWMAPFTPSLDVSKLLHNNRVSCKSRAYQNIHKVILLSKANDSCTIKIPRLRNEEYSKGKLSLVDSGATVTVRYLPNGDSSDEEPEAIILVPIKAPSFKPTSFVVLEKGGTLIVECEGCSQTQNKAIRVKFE